MFAIYLLGMCVFLAVKFDNVHPSNGGITLQTLQMPVQNLLWIHQLLSKLTKIGIHLNCKKKNQG